MIESGPIQPLNAVGREQISVGDQAGNHAMRPDARNNLVELRMKQSFAATDGH